jgi:F0F1-type ATP synthase membrane subunit b/b'
MELNPLKQLNPAVVAATIATFTVTYVVMRKVFYLPTIEVMERRNVRRLEADEKYAEAQSALAEAEGEATRIREEADAQVREAVEQSRSKVESERESRLAAARAAAEILLEQGRAAMSEEAELERASLRSEVVECVSLSCEKLFGRVDRAVVESNVDRVIAKTVH